MANNLMTDAVNLLALQEECRLISREISRLQEDIQIAMSGRAQKELIALMKDWLLVLRKSAEGLEEDRLALIREAGRIEQGDLP